MISNRANSEDDSSLDCNELSSVDKREAFGILTSLGKKYYKSIGMGKSLDIAKLRQLQGSRHNQRLQMKLLDNYKTEKVDWIWLCAWIH